MLQKKLITVPFSGGLDEQSDPKQAPPGRFLRLVNCLRTKNGVIQKRRGFRALTKIIYSVFAPSLVSAAKLATYGNQTLVTDGNTLYSYAPTLGRLVGEDSVSPCTARREIMAWTTPSIPSNLFTGYPSLDSTATYALGYRIAVWAQDQDVFYTIYDDANGACIAPVSSVVHLASGHTPVTPKVIYPGTGTIVFCIYGDAADNGKVFATKIDLAGLPGSVPSWVAPSTLETNRTGVGGFDAIPYGTGFLIAWPIQSGLQQQAFVAQFSPAFANLLGNALSITTNNNEVIRAIGLGATAGEGIFVGIWTTDAANNARLRCQPHDPSTLLTMGSLALVASGVTNADPGYTTVGAEAVGFVRATHNTTSIVARVFSHATGNMPLVLHGVVDTGGNVQLGPLKLFNTTLLSRPFVVNGHVCALVLSRTGSSHYVVELQYAPDPTGLPLAPTNPARPICTVAPRISRNVTGAQERGVSSLASVVQGTSSTDLLTVSNIAASGELDGPMGITIIRLDFAPRLAWQGTEMARDAQLTGGAPSTFDGRTNAEIGFLWPPAIVGLVQEDGTVGGSGSLVLGGTYTWVVVATWIDANGQVHRSQPSAPVTYTVPNPGTGFQAVRFMIRHITLTTRTDSQNGFQPRIRCEIYRTTNGGTTLFRTQPIPSLDQPSGATVFSSIEYVYNDVTAEMTVWINDGLSDTQIAPNPQIYTGGGVLESVCPPSAKFSFTYKQRLVLAGCDDPKQVWMSQPVSDGDALRFTDLNVFRVDEGGDLTAGYQLDQQMILFKEDRIFWLAGDGSSETGTGADITNPNRLACDKGAIDQRSLAVIPQGLAYQSRVGLCLLRRDLSVDVLWGRVVQDELAAYPVITSAVVDKDLGQLRFTCLATEGASKGIFLIFDYVSEQWSTQEFANGDPTSSAYLAGMVAAVLANGSYTCVTAAGQIYQESTSSYMDEPSNGAAKVYVNMIAEGANIALAGLQGAQRIWKAGILGERVSSHDLVVELATNYEDTPSVSRRFGSSELDSIRDQPVVSLLVSPKKQRCSAIRVRVHDEYPSGYQGPGSGQGPLLSAFSFEAGVMPRSLPRPRAAKE